MQSYKLLYSDYRKQMVFIIVFPVIIIAPVFFFIFTFSHLQDLVLFSICLSWIGIMIYFFKLILLGNIYNLSNVTINEKEMIIKPIKPTFFNKVEVLKVELDNIRSVTKGEDNRNENRRYYTLSLSEPKRKIVLMFPPKTGIVEMDQFELALFYTPNDVNTDLTDTVVKRSDFYSSILAKLITLLCFAFLIVFTLLKICVPNAVHWYNLLWFYLISFGWLKNFFGARRRSQLNERN